MAEIEVTPQGARRFRVVVREGSSETSHAVGVPDGYPGEIGVSAEDEPLVRESFRFLLEREPKESILSRFDLATIARYFPEYPDEMARRLS